MQELFRGIASYVALGIEAAAVLIVAYGAIEALAASIRASVQRRSRTGQRKEIWLGFGMWLVLRLEFALGADIVRTAISPTWNEIGQLAAIGFIRTFLNFFLEKDLQKYEPRKDGTQKTGPEALAA
jgi:uncharacterized membrane protein